MGTEIDYQWTYGPSFPHMLWCMICKRHFQASAQAKSWVSISLINIDFQAQKDAEKAAKKEKALAKQAKLKAEQEQRKSAPSAAQSRKAQAEEAKVRFQRFGIKSSNPPVVTGLHFVYHSSLPLKFPVRQLNKKCTWKCLVVRLDICWTKIASLNTALAMRLICIFF